jgi:hypothetical protein
MLRLYRKLCHLRDTLGNGPKGNLVMIIVAGIIWLVILAMQIHKFIS